jgi:branched-chain amino acid transport system substrate-binding protein
MAAYAADQLHARKVVVIYPAVPNAQYAAEHFIKPVLMAKGVSDVTLLGTAITQPDKSATMTAAAQHEPDAIIAVDSGSGCLSLLQNHASLAPAAKLLITGGCLEASIVKNAGGAAEGVYAPFEFLNEADAADPDARVFTEALAAYGPPDIRMTQFAAAGFAGVMNIYNTLKGMAPTQLDPAHVLDVLKQARNVPNFMAHPFTCDGRVKLAPAVCNTAQRIVQVQSGKPVDVGGGWIDGSAWIS